MIRHRGSHGDRIGLGLQLDEGLPHGLGRTSRMTLQAIQPGGVDAQRTVHQIDAGSAQASSLGQ